MPTLLLRCEGPVQSWGTRSRFAIRDTGLEPSKSGITGLLACALGYPRGADIGRLSSLLMGVRVDREGSVRTDYHTVLEVPKARGSERETMQTWRDYLDDASFLVGLEHEDRALLEELDRALNAPAHQLALGRRACVPSVPVAVPGGGVREAALEEALRSESGVEGRRVRLVIEEHGPGPGLRIQNDQLGPGATFANRWFVPRYTRTCYAEIPGEATVGKLDANEDGA